MFTNKDLDEFKKEYDECIAAKKYKKAERIAHRVCNCLEKEINKWVDLEVDAYDKTIRLPSNIGHQ